MTQEQFDETEWTAGMVGRYKGEEYRIIAVDFGEQLVGLSGVIQSAAEGEIYWARCENVTISQTEVHSNKQTT